MSIERIRTTITRWRCTDGHLHQKKDRAIKCENGRDARIEAKAWREQWERECKQREIEDQERREAERLAQIEREQLAIALRDRFAVELIEPTHEFHGLDSRVAVALAFSGIKCADDFRKRYVTDDNTLDLAGLYRMPGLEIDDYPQLVSWVNAHQPLDAALDNNPHP